MKRILSVVPSEKALPVSAEGILEQEDKVRCSLNVNITVACKANNCERRDKTIIDLAISLSLNN